MNMVIPGQVFLKECIDSPYCKRSRLLLSFISSMRNVYLARETLRFGCCRISVFYPWLFLFGVSFLPMAIFIWCILDYFNWFKGA